MGLSGWFDEGATVEGVDVGAADYFTDMLDKFL